VGQFWTPITPQSGSLLHADLHIIGVIKDISAEKGLEELPDWQIRTSDILLKFNEGRPVDKYVSSQWIGKKLKSLSLRHRTVNGRSEILLESKEYWSLMEQYGCARRDSKADDDNSDETLQEFPGTQYR